MTAAPVTSTPAREHGRLHHGALGLPSVLFCIVTGAAPLDRDAVQRPRLLPWVVLAMFVAGMAIAVWLRGRRPHLYADLGHFTLTDLDDEARIAV
jgi:hypothetical protein